MREIKQLGQIANESLTKLSSKGHSHTELNAPSHHPFTTPNGKGMLKWFLTIER